MKTKLLLLAAIFVIAPIQAQRFDVVIEPGAFINYYDKKVSYTMDMKRADQLSKELKRQGFTCDSVSYLYARLEHWGIACNYERYSFILKDYGGKWIVHVVSSVWS